MFLRVTKMYASSDQSNAHLIYDYSPTFTKFKKNLNNFDFAGTKWTTNKFGFRDPKMKLPKTLDTLRIAVIGDSWGAGWGIKEEESIPRQLEVILNEKSNQKVEVHNFSIPGMNLDQTSHAISEVSKFNPDVILYLIHLNDITFDLYNENTKNEQKNKTEATTNYFSRYSPKELLQQSNVFNLVYSTLIFPLGNYFKFNDSSAVSWFNEQYREDGNRWKKYQTFVGNISETLKKNSLEMQAYILPISFLSQNYVSFSPIYTRVKNSFNKKDIKTISLRELYSNKSPSKFRISPIDAHPNPYASKLLATEIAKTLILPSTK